jgi:hypothetical protein
MTMTRNRMVEHDTATFALMTEAWKTEAAIDRHRENMHRAVGDKRHGLGRRSEWEMTFAQVCIELGTLAVCGNEKIEKSAARMLQGDSELVSRFGELSAEISRMDAIFQVRPWSRYFRCLNTDGHIHSTLRACPTVRWDTAMSWETQMSGLSANSAIHGVEGQFEGLGETLCSVCFPEAPAEWCRTRSEVTRAEREAARAAKTAAREDALAVKNLAEPFITHDGDKVTTVAAAKALVRKAAETAVELEWYKTSEDARKPWKDMPERLAEFIARAEARLAAEMADARAVNKVLIAREIAVPGTGWFQAGSDEAVHRTVKRARKAYFG